MQTYSQYGEDEIIIEIVGDHIGRVLDIGAYHPTQFSNSRALIERGWSALLVEPSPEPFLSLLREYGKLPRITLVQAAIGVSRGLELMHATADAVSTTCERVHEVWREAGGYYGDFYTPVLTPAELLAKFGSSCAVLNVDTEGTSIDVLAEFLKHIAPPCICVEHDSRMPELHALVEQYRYQIVHQNGTNAILRTV